MFTPTEKDQSAKKDLNKIYRVPAKDLLFGVRLVMKEEG